MGGKEHTEKYQLLQVLEFNSKRKRMSVIVKDEQGRIWIYCKGADNFLFKRMRNPCPLKGKTDEILTKYANTGLRTLVVGARQIPQKEYDDWEVKYQKAKVTKGEKDERKEAMMDAQELIEVELELIGATAIEDKLQEDVDDTIFSLKQAGIKVWVLTGDKIETAINIGFSCKLLDATLKQLFIKGNDKYTVIKEMDEALELIRKAEQKAEEADGESAEQTKFALILSGDSFIYITHVHNKDCYEDQDSIVNQEGFKEVDLKKKFIEITDKCEVVLGCRVSPKQKAQVVALLRNAKPNKQTLAIGDGANDVNMIIAAHVGIGIKGVEGNQAARSSDYSIAQFKFLKRLLLLYGRESLRKNGNLIMYNFYKNMLLGFPLFFFGFSQGMSGTTFYETQLNMQLYNITYTAYPIIVYALLDKEFKGTEIANKPYLYIGGRKGLQFNKKLFWWEIFLGGYQGFILVLVILFQPQFSLASQGDPYPHGTFLGISYTAGQRTSFWESGIMMYTAVILIANYKVIKISYHGIRFYGIIEMVPFTIILSLILYFGLLLLWDDWFEFPLISDNIYYGTFWQIFWNMNTYFEFILIFGLTSLIDVAIQRFQYYKRIAVESKIQKEILEVERLIKEHGGGRIQFTVVKKQSKSKWKAAKKIMSVSYMKQSMLSLRNANQNAHKGFDFSSAKKLEDYEGDVDVRIKTFKDLKAESHSLKQFDEFEEIAIKSPKVQKKQPSKSKQVKKIIPLTEDYRARLKQTEKEKQLKDAEDKLLQAQQQTVTIKQTISQQEHGTGNVDLDSKNYGQTNLPAEKEHNQQNAEEVI